MTGVLSALRVRAEEAARRTVETCAATALDTALREVPVDTGRLRASISVASDGVTASVGTSCPYAVYVETGSSRCAPRPFLRPAFEAAARSVRDGGETR